MVSGLEAQFNTFLQLVKDNEVLLDNLIPICEQAIEEKNRDIAIKCLDYFFSKEGPKTQYLYRAYTCRAMLSVPQSIFDYDGILKMGEYFIKAVDIDKSYKMYRFLVYNISIDFMACSRPFLCQDTRKFLLRPLQFFSKALEDSEETDLEWRVQIMRQVVLSLHESNRKEEAAKLATMLLELSKKVSKNILRENQIFISSNQISELKEHKYPNEVLVIAKANRLKWYLLNSISLSHSDLANILGLLTTYDAKDKLTFEQTNLFSFLPGEIRDMDINLKSVILVLIGTVSLLSEYLGLADECICELQQLSPFDPQTEVLYTFLILSLQAKKISDKIHSKSGLKRYKELLLGISQQIHNANVNKNIEAIEIGSCVFLHLSLVLCQPTLRKYIKRDLLDISHILNQNGSQLYTLRSFIFRELAQCEEQDEEIDLALQHLQLSIQYNNGEQWLIIQNSEISRLKLKNEVYIKPEDKLERAVQMLDQVKFISEVQRFREFLLQIGENIIGHSISPFLDSQLNCNFTTFLNEDADSILDYLDQCVNLYTESCKLTQLHQYSPERDKMCCHLLFELSKISRKMEIWDICRCACRLCLSYNDGRWGTLPAMETLSVPADKISLNSTLQSLVTSKASIISEHTSSTQPNIIEGDTKILLIFAEAQYILAECCVELILKYKLTLYETPNLLNFNLNLIYKEDQRWIKFCFWINKLSVSVVAGFISTGFWAIYLKQNWLVSNCLACFWNYIKHLIILKKEYSIIQPLRDIYHISNSKAQIKPQLVVFKLSIALMKALVHESLNRIHTDSTPPTTPLKKPTSRNERERKKALGASPSITPETNWNADSVQLLKEANEICDINFSLLSTSVSDIGIFEILVPIWVKIQKGLNQPIYLDQFCERFNNHKYKNLLRAMVIIEVLLTSNSILSNSDISIYSAFESLATSNTKSSLITLELWSKLALLSLKADQHDKVASCVEYGRINGTILLDKNLKFETKNKVYILLSKLESILGLSWYDSSLHTSSNELLDQFITACGYADKAYNIEFVIYNLKMFWNLCKPMPNKPELTCFLVEKAHIVLSILSHYSKGDFPLNPTSTTDKDIKTEILTLLLDAFCDQCSWKTGLHFLELALTQVLRDSHSYFVKYTILFKSKQDINAIMNILRFSEEIDQIDQSNLYLLAAHASNDCQNKFDYYKGAINSLNGKNHVLLRINVKLEFFRWMVMINFSHKLLITLLEESLSELVEYIAERLTYQSRNGDAYMGNNKSSEHTQSYHPCIDDICPLGILDNFEEWTLNEIDIFFQILMMVFILHGKFVFQKYQFYLKLLIFCTYTMLKLAFIQNFETKIIPDQGKKGKVVIKPKIEDSTPNILLPKNLEEWSKYFPSHNNLSLSTSNQCTLLEYSLVSPNLTLYYLHHLNKELKNSVFSHFQLFPLALINAISLACDKCPKGWSKLSFIGLLGYSKSFNFESSFEFWLSKLDGNYFAQEDISLLMETKIIGFNQCIDPSILILPTISSLYNQNVGHLITFQKTHFIIFIALEISSILLELNGSQAIIDIVYECESFLEVFPSNIFDFHINDLKTCSSTAYFESIGHKEYPIIFQGSLFPISKFLESSLSLSRLLEYTLAIQYLENTIQLIPNFRKEKDSGYYTHIRVIFEIELATRQLNFYLSNFSKDTNEKREIIDIDISLELLYSCFCLLNASHNYIDSNYALKKYVYFLDKFAMNNDFIFSHISNFASVNKTLKCYKRIIDLNKEIISFVVSVSLDFDVDLDKDTSIHSELVDSHISLTTFCVSVFQVRTEFINSDKFKVNMYSQTEKYIDEYVYKEPHSSNIYERFMPNNISLITDSITTLRYLQKISSCHLIELEMGRAMLSLYSYHGQDMFEDCHCIVNDVNHLKVQSHITMLEYKENEHSHSKSIIYFASGIRYYQKYLLNYLKCDTSYLQTLKDICCRFLTLIGCYDRKQSVQYLTLYQSFSCSSYFTSIISKLLENHSDSKLAALNLIGQNFSSQSNFFRLNIQPDFFEFIKEMPSNFRYLILQHSIDMSTLYIAYTQQPPTPKTNKGVIPPIDWLPIYGRCQVNPNTIQEIFLMLKDTSEQTRLYNCKEPDSVKNIFQDITATIHAYFNCIIPLIEPIIHSETNPQNLILFILCDENILSLPIEVLSSFAPLKIFGQISRDFSLQILNHRFKSLQHQNKENVKDKLKDSVPPITSEFDHDIFDISNTRYYIDPYDSFTSPSNVNEEFQTMLRKSLALNQKLTNKWSGIIGTTNYQSLYNKWNVFKSDNILYLLPGLFNFHYPLDLLISSSYSKRYNLVLLFDKIFYDYTESGILNDHFLPTEIYSSTVIAGLLSIIGGNIIVTNIRPMTSYSIANILTCFFNCVIKEGYTISRSIQYIDNREFQTEEATDQESSAHMPSGIITYGLTQLHA